MIILLLFSARLIDAQDVKQLTFQEVITLSEEQSPDALIAKHTPKAKGSR